MSSALASAWPCPQRLSRLAALVTRRALRRLAGEQAFERGEAYFTGGQVLALDEHEGALAATVRGSRDYQVKLRAVGDDLAYACTCPAGADSVFCKHGVAAGPGEFAKPPPSEALAALVVEQALAFA